MKNKQLNLFRYKKNTLSFILSLLLVFFSIVGINLFSISGVSLNNDYAFFPDNITIFDNMDGEYSEGKIEGLYPNAKYVSYVYATDLELDIPSLKGYTYKIFGVDKNFINVPIISSTKDEKCFAMSSIVAGDNITDLDDDRCNQVALMYAKQYNYFDMEASQGQININNYPFYIKGLLQSNVGIEDTDEITKDSTCFYFFIPRSTFLNMLPDDPAGPRYKKLFYVDTTGYKTINDDTILESYGIRSENIFSVAIHEAEINKSRKYFDNLFLWMSIILTAISSISLIIVGLINVKNRYAEIGIRRAVGASKDDVCFKFFRENFVLMTLSTIIGFLMGLFAVFLIYEYITLSSNFLTFHFEWYFSLMFFCIYLLITSIVYIIPSLAAANINISVILKEEK